MLWQEGPARSFDWAQALRPVTLPIMFAIKILPALLDRIFLSRFAILEKATPWNSSENQWLRLNSSFREKLLPNALKRFTDIAIPGDEFLLEVLRTGKAVIFHIPPEGIQMLSVP